MYSEKEVYVDETGEKKKVKVPRFIRYVDAIPHVIKNGLAIGGDINHKERGYNTIIMAAPVTFNGSADNSLNGEYYVAVAVKRKGIENNRISNRPYVVDVLAIKKNQFAIGARSETNLRHSQASVGSLRSMLEHVAGDVKYYEENFEKKAYSLTIEDDSFFDMFGESNSTYTESSSILEEGMEALKHKKVDAESIRKVANKLKREYGSTIDTDTEGDMPGMLYDTLTALRPSPVNNYGADREGVSRDLAMRIVEEYLNVQGDAKSKSIADRMRKQSAKYRAELRSRYEQRLKDAKADLREKYGMRTNDVRIRNAEKIAEIRAKNRESAKDARLKRLADHEKQMISKRAKDLMKWVSEPTEKHHVPREMVMPVTEFLYAMDFVEPDVKQNDKGQFYVRVYNHSVVGAGGGMSHVFDTLTGDTKEDVLRQFHEAINGGIGSRAQRMWSDRMQLMRNLLDKVNKGEQFDNRSMNDFLQTIDPTLAEEFDDMLEKHGGVANINQLGYKELHTINIIVRGVTHAINQGNKAFTMNEMVADLAEKTMKSAEGKKGPKAHNVAVKKGIKTLRLDMATPQTFFMVNSADKVYKSLRKAFNTKTADIRKASEYMKGVVKGIKNEELATWTGNKCKIREFSVYGGMLRLTPAQIMSLYCLTHRNQAMLHAKGGFRADVIRQGTRELEQKQAVHLTESDLATIIGTLTPEQRYIADTMQKYMATECAKQGNEAAMLMYGYEKFTDDDYFPIRVDKTMTATNNSNITEELINSIERMGITKQTAPNASNPIMLCDIFDVFASHVSDMATYHGFAPAIKDALRWFNYKTVEEAGDNQDWSSVKNAVETLSGVGGCDYFTKLITDLNGKEKSQDVGNVFDFVMSGYKAASVGANIRVVIQQPTSYFRAMSVIDPKYLLGVSPREALAAGRKMREQSEIAWWKSQGYFETSIGKSMKNIVLGQASMREKLRDKSMWLAGMADDLTWGVLYGAVTKEQTALAEGENLSQEELDSRISGRFDDVIDMTQVVDSTLHRSQYMRSKGTFTKMQTAFMSEPTKNYNMLMQAVVQDMRARKLNKVPRAAIGFASSSVICAAAAALIDAMRGAGDDDNWGEVYKEALLNNAIENLNPIGMIPVAKDIANYGINKMMGNTYFNSSNRMDLDAINSLIDAAEMTVKYMNGNSNKTPYGMILTLSRPLSQLTGIPAYNLTRDMTALYNQFFPDLKKTVASNKYTPVYEAIKRGRGIDEAVKKAIENGGIIKDIQSGITSRYHSDYYEMLQTDPKQAAELAEKAKMGYIATGMSEADADAKIKEWETEAYSYSELDKAIESGEGISEAMQKAVDNKKPDNISKHTVDRYESTIEYQNQNDIDNGLEGNIDSALGEIGRSYQSAKGELDRKAAEKAEKAEQDEKKAGYKKKIFDSIDSGAFDYKDSVKSLKDMGVSSSTIKGDITEKYKDSLVEFWNSGKDVTKTMDRIAKIKAYVDELFDGKKSFDEYYKKEYKEIKEWFK